MRPLIPAGTPGQRSRRVDVRWPAATLQQRVDSALAELAGDKAPSNEPESELPAELAERKCNVGEGGEMPLGLDFKCALLGSTAWFRQLGAVGRARAQKMLEKLKERVDAKLDVCFCKPECWESLSILGAVE